MSNVAVKIPLSSRINFRMIAFAAFMMLLIGYPLWVYVDAELSKGIKQTADGYAVDLKAMSTFEFDQVNGTIDDIPQKWRELDGKRVTLVGDMWTGNSASPKLTQFDLCYSVAKCCFSGPPQVQHFVTSRSTTGKELPYYSNQVEVKGTLHVNVLRGDGKVASVFQLDVESVEPVL